MRRAFIVIIIAVLAGACGKKPAPASAKQPAPEEKKSEDADKDGAPDTDATPRSTGADPCEGGENK